MRATVEGALARAFDLSEAAGPAPQMRLRLAPSSRGLRGPDKYAVLAHRRHQAQIKARRLLDLADRAAAGGQPHTA